MNEKHRKLLMKVVAILVMLFMVFAGFTVIFL